MRIAGIYNFSKETVILTEVTGKKGILNTEPAGLSNDIDNLVKIEGGYRQNGAKAILLKEND